jgi:hypothetical protein
VNARVSRPQAGSFVRQRPGRPLAPPPMMDENKRFAWRSRRGPEHPWCRRAEAGDAWCGSWSPCDNVAQEPVEPLIAGMRATARLVSGRLLPAMHTAPSTREPRTRPDNRPRAHHARPAAGPAFACASPEDALVGFTGQPRDEPVAWRVAGAWPTTAAAGLRSTSPCISSRTRSGPT